MKKLWGLMILVLLVGLAFPVTRQLSSSQEAFTPDNLIRIHVVANSDSQLDQATKLKVRDRLVEFLTPSLSHSKSVTQSYRILTENLDVIQHLACDEIRLNKGNYGAKVALGVFDFPTRQYGELVLPQGEYNALRVVLGDGKGKNWWCVLYPPLCFTDQKEPVAKKTPELLVSKMIKKAVRKSAAYKTSNHNLD